MRTRPLSSRVRRQRAAWRRLRPAPSARSATVTPRETLGAAATATVLRSTRRRMLWASALSESRRPESTIRRRRAGAARQRGPRQQHRQAPAGNEEAGGEEVGRSFGAEHRGTWTGPKRVVDRSGGIHAGCSAFSDNPRAVVLSISGSQDRGSGGSRSLGFHEDRRPRSSGRCVTGWDRAACPWTN